MLLAAIELIKADYRPMEKSEYKEIDADGSLGPIQVCYNRMAMGPAAFRKTYEELCKEFAYQCVLTNTKQFPTTIKTVG